MRYSSIGDYVLAVRSWLLTMCGFLEAKFPSPPCRCRTSGGRYFLRGVKLRDDLSNYLAVFSSHSSFKNDQHLRTYELVEASHRQPTGPRYKLKQADSFFVVHFFDHLQAREGKKWRSSYSDLNNSLRSLTTHSTVPARTSGSVCCSWCNVCRWCSSASRPNRSPASHTASTAADGGEKKTLDIYNSSWRHKFGEYCVTHW